MDNLVERIANLSSIKRELFVSELKKRGLVEPIAVIGIGCRFPGGADSPQSFWQLLRNGVDAITEVPADRWDINAFYAPDPLTPGKMSTRWGGFLEHVDQFDAQFFDISPREAMRIDPQQRILMEVAWEALEDAGQVTKDLAGSNVGVFIGIGTYDYGQMQLSNTNLSDAYAGMGAALSIAANRISYLLDFRGPSIAVDTACSSSLVAIHLACQSLWKEESSLALVGGVNMLLSPALTINFSKAGFMSPDGRCKSFDARANGYVRSEGAGAVILKPLSKALNDADSIYAVIRGSAVNQDGRSNGLTAPNRAAQEAVLRSAYQCANISPADVKYIEAHGTGTPLGDPIEAHALGTVLAVGRAPGDRCALGSVKSNIGHLETAAGIAGIIKVALALKERALPPSLHFQQANPNIPFETLPLRVQTQFEPWPEDAGRMIAGVSSFGFGGTNAHVVMEEAPQLITAPQPEDPRAARILPLSARTPEALRALAKEYLQLFKHYNANVILSLRNICYTASMRRVHHEYRLAIVAHSREEFIERLELFLQEKRGPGLFSDRKEPNQRLRLVFDFPGQGPQWWAMGRQLIEGEPIFRAVIERCDEALKQYNVKWSLMKELLAASEAESRLDETEIAQPAVFAIQIALAELWRTWGITPEAVVGHSLGEVAAAYIAGSLTFDEALRVVYHRSRIMQRTTGLGKMAVVIMTMEEAKAAIAGYEDQLSIAASNSHTQTLLSGDTAAIDSVLERLDDEGVVYRKLQGRYAFHSHQMYSLQDELTESLQGLQPKPSQLPIYSTLTGHLSTAQDFDAVYWGRHMHQPVLFGAAIDCLIEEGYNVFVEISPHPPLTGAIAESFRRHEKKERSLPSLRRGEADRDTMLGSLAALYCIGYPVDWRKLYPVAQPPTRIPSYPWQRKRHWLEKEEYSPASDSWRGAGTGGHMILGRYFRSAYPAGRHFWENRLDKEHFPFLNDHRVQGMLVVPGALYVEMALAAAAEVFGEGPCVLTNLEFRQALFLPEEGSRVIQFVLSVNGGKEAAFQIFSSTDGTHDSWLLHATGKILQQSSIVANPPALALDTIKARCPEQISHKNFYQQCQAVGIEFGSTFQNIEQIWRNEKEAICHGHTPKNLEAEVARYQIHPTVLDICFQLLPSFQLASDNVNTDGQQRAYLPVGVDQVRFYAKPGLRLSGHARLFHRVMSNTDSPEGDVRLVDEQGHAIIDLLGLHYHLLESHKIQRSSAADISESLYQLNWQLKRQPEAVATEAIEATEASAPASRSWLIFADRRGVGSSLAGLLADAKERAIMVYAGDAYAQTGLDEFVVRPAQAEDIRAVFNSLLSEPLDCAAIIYLWGLDATLPADVAALQASQQRGCGTLLPLVQELERGWPKSSRLWLVTENAQPVLPEGAPLAYAQAPLWGFGRTVAQELSARWGGLIDLEAETLPELAAAQLWQQISQPDGEDQVAFREERRYVARLQRQSPPSELLPPLRWRADGTYLITGGLGDLGLLVARWMVEQGARRLILLSRTELPPRAQWQKQPPGSALAARIATILELEELGASIHLASVDIADETALTAFLDKFREECWPPIVGVVHSAGLLRDQTLMQMDNAALEQVLRPKIIGGWLLDRLLTDLDLFVVFSSVASVLGSPGQGNYAAANAFLDSLAHHRRAAGRAAITINWGPWAEIGMAAQGNRGDRLAAQGMESIAPHKGLEIFAQLLRQETVQTGVMMVNWPKWSQSYPVLGAAAFLSELISEQTETSAPLNVGRAKTKTGLNREEILQLAATERLTRLKDYLSLQIAKLLRLPDAQLDLDQSINNFGVDSLIAVELDNQIEVDLGVALTMVTFLRGPSIAQLAQNVLTMIEADAPQTASDNGGPVGAPAAAAMVNPQRKSEVINKLKPVVSDSSELMGRIDNLSEEELDSLLFDMLAEEEEESINEG